MVQTGGVTVSSGITIPSAGSHSKPLPAAARQDSSPSCLGELMGSHWEQVCPLSMRDRAANRLKSQAVWPVCSNSSKTHSCPERSASFPPSRPRGILWDHSRDVWDLPRSCARCFVMHIELLLLPSPFLQQPQLFPLSRAAPPGCSQLLEVPKPGTGVSLLPQGLVSLSGGPQHPPWHCLPLGFWLSGLQGQVCPAWPEVGTVAAACPHCCSPCGPCPHGPQALAGSAAPSPACLRH